MNEYWWSWIMFPVFIIYGIICFTGVLGNLLVIYLVMGNRTMYTITNLFIVNLAISDILMSCVAAPITPLAVSWKEWQLPTALCKFFPMTMGVSVYVSTLTCTAIAVNRYYVTVRPGLTKMTMNLCLVVVFVTWVVATLISLPLGVYQKTITHNNTNETSCREMWPKEASRETFTMVNFLLQFVAPGTIISSCYWKISTALRKQYLANTLALSATQHSLVRKQRTNQMLILMMVVFVVCWIPLNLWWIIMDFIITKYYPTANQLIHEDILVLLFYICHLLAMSSAVYNPVIYIYMNENFKREFRKVSRAMITFCRHRYRRDVLRQAPITEEIIAMKLYSQHYCNESNGMRRPPLGARYASYPSPLPPEQMLHAQIVNDVYYVDSRDNTTVNVSRSNDTNSIFSGMEFNECNTSFHKCPLNVSDQRYHFNHSLDDTRLIRVEEDRQSSSNICSRRGVTLNLPRIHLTNVEETSSMTMQYADEMDEYNEYNEYDVSDSCPFQLTDNSL